MFHGRTELDSNPDSDQLVQRSTGLNLVDLIQEPKSSITAGDQGGGVETTSLASLPPMQIDYSSDWSTNTPYSSVDIRPESTHPETDADLLSPQVGITELTGNQRPIERPEEPGERDLRLIGTGLTRGGLIDEDAIRRYLQGYTWFERNVQSTSSRAQQLTNQLNSRFNLNPPVQIRFLPEVQPHDNTRTGGYVPPRFSITTRPFVVPHTFNLYE